MTWTYVDEHPFPEKEFKPQPFFSGIPGKNSSNHVTSVNDYFDS